MIVTSLWRYPVKSCGGLAARTLVIEPRGVVGDRRLAVYGVDGKLGSGKTTRRFRRMDGLLDVEVVGAEPLVLRVAGREVAGADADRALSDLVGEPVAIREETTVRHHDQAPIHVVTTGGLRWLADRLGGPVDPRRFRPNLVLDGDDPPVGSLLTIGAVTLRITERTERCVMTTTPQPGLPGDPRVLRILADEVGACFGVYAVPERLGVVAVGERAAVG